jgi:hypothetical protein
MLGRSIDEILPHPGDPPLHEAAVHTVVMNEDSSLSVLWR